MRALIAMILMMVPAVAQPVWTPAPVPTGMSPSVMPADRAGSGRTDAAGPASGTPFSAAPPTAPSTAQPGGQTSPADRDIPGSTAASTPALGK